MSVRIDFFQGNQAATVTSSSNPAGSAFKIQYLKDEVGL
jgi:hypothetical protein